MEEKKVFEQEKESEAAGDMAAEEVIVEEPQKEEAEAAESAEAEPAAETEQNVEAGEKKGFFKKKEKKDITNLQDSEFSNNYVNAYKDMNFVRFKWKQNKNGKFYKKKKKKKKHIVGVRVCRYRK